jgi:hypothetical protein
MAINTKKVVIAGLAAGVVLNICDYVLNGMLFADRMKTDMNAFKPGLGDAMSQMDTNTIVGFVIMDLVIGMLLAYTYAAMRPRFGAGAKTAIITALIFWIFGSVITSNFLLMGMMSTGLWWSFGMAYLVCLIITALVAGALYSEDSAVTA